MRAVIRSWLGLAALGAGLIHLGLVIGSPPPTAVALLIVGSAELAWAIACFMASAAPLPRVALAGALAPVVAWGALLATGAEGLLAGIAFLPMAVASIFDLTIAALLAPAVRRTFRGHDAARDAEPTPNALAYIAGVFAGAVVVAALTTPALAETRAGSVAQPHGSHFGPSPAEGPEHHGH